MRITFALCVLVACSSLEDEAAETARAWLAVPVDAQIKAWPLVCDDDQAARPIDHLEPGDAPVRALPEHVARLKQAEEGLTFTITSVRVDPEGVAGTVLAEARGELGVHEVRVDLERRDDGWCVSTGWAEARRHTEAAAAIEAELDVARQLHVDWKPDEAKARLTDLGERLAALPDDHEEVARVREVLNRLRAEVDQRHERWLGGRWTREVTKDAMTDSLHATAVLHAVEGFRVGDRVRGDATLVLRCDGGALGVQVTGHGLHPNDTTLRHRFGDAPAEALQVARMELGARALPDPQSWLTRFAQHDGGQWRVEAPTLAGPATATFDLTAARAAVDLVTRACATWGGSAK